MVRTFHLVHHCSNSDIVPFNQIYFIQLKFLKRFLSIQNSRIDFRVTNLALEINKNIDITLCCFYQIDFFICHSIELRDLDSNQGDDFQRVASYH